MTDYDEKRHVLIADVEEEGLGYEWHTGGLIVDGMSGQLFWAYDSGCSCNYFLDHATDMESVANWQAAVEKAKEDFGDAEAARFAEKILDLIGKGKFIPTRTIPGEVQHSAVGAEKEQS